MKEVSSETALACGSPARLSDGMSMMRSCHERGVFRNALACGCPARFSDGMSMMRSCHGTAPTAPVLIRNP